MNEITLKNGYKVKVVNAPGGYRAQLISPGIGVIAEPHGSDRIKAVTSLMRDLKMGFSTGDVAMGEEIQDHLQKTLDQLEDVNVYLDFPPEAKTASEKKTFESYFRQWTRAVRENPSGDIQHIADQLSPEFGLNIQQMLYPAVIRNHIVKELRGVSFVRFNVRSPKGKKIWLKA